MMVNTSTIFNSTLQCYWGGMLLQTNNTFTTTTFQTVHNLVPTQLNNIGDGIIKNKQKNTQLNQVERYVIGRWYLNKKYKI